MIDEGFHLTPLDVRRYDFGSKLRGADPVKVQQFREQVAEELERLTRVNQELEAKAKGFHEQLRAFRERDKALNDALVSAQQLRGEIRDQAEKEGGLVMREAQLEAERIVDSAKTEVRMLQMQVAALEKSRRNFTNQLRTLVQRQLDDLSATEGLGLPTLPSELAPRPATPRERATPVDQPAHASSGARSQTLSPVAAPPGPLGADGQAEDDDGNASGTPAWLEAFQQE